MLTGPGARVINGFSIVIQIKWEFSFGVIPILTQRLQQNFAKGTTAVLLRHGQRLVANWWRVIELQQDEWSSGLIVSKKSLVKRGPSNKNSGT